MYSHSTDVGILPFCKSQHDADSDWKYTFHCQCSLVGPWHAYLEGSINIIDMVTDHKNLEYFTTTKKLMQRQVHWSEYLSQFNAKIQFQLGRLGTKPDALTCCWDLYQEEGRNANSSANIQPIFLSEQLVDTSITGHVSSLTPSQNTFSKILHHANILDTISSIILNDDLAQLVIKKLNSTDPLNGWMQQTDSPYIPNNQDHCLKI